MKLEKKHIMWMIFFIFIVFFAYITVSSFFSNNLNFKTFYMYEKTTTEYDDNQIEFTLNDNNEIVYVAKSNDKFIVEKIYEDNVEPQRIISFQLENVDVYSFDKIGKYYYFFYNNDESLIRIDENTKTMIKVETLPNGMKIVNPFDDKCYVYNNYKLEIIKEIDNLDENFDIPSYINDIKKIEFLTYEEIVISTYNADLYVYNLIDLNVHKIDKKILNYYIYNQSIYSTFTEKDKLGIHIYTNNEDKTFFIDGLDYLTMKVKDDYIYLIDKKYIYKISISRQKRHETLEISEYASSYYDISDILIVNEKLMYIKMAKEEFVQLQNEVRYYLYRYKV